MRVPIQNSKRKLEAQLLHPHKHNRAHAQNRVSEIVNREDREEIPDSDYYKNTVIILFPYDSYRHEVSGTDIGTYGLLVTYLKEGNTIDSVATNIPAHARF